MKERIKDWLFIFMYKHLRCKFTGKIMANNFFVKQFIKYLWN